MRTAPGQQPRRRRWRHPRTTPRRRRRRPAPGSQAPDDAEPLQEVRQLVLLPQLWLRRRPREQELPPPLHRPQLGSNTQQHDGGQPEGHPQDDPSEQPLPPALRAAAAATAGARPTATVATAARTTAPATAAPVRADGHAAASHTTTAAAAARLTFQCAISAIYGTCYAWCTHAAPSTPHAPTASTHDGHVRPATSSQSGGDAVWNGIRTCLVTVRGGTCV